MHCFSQSASSRGSYLRALLCSGPMTSGPEAWLGAAAALGPEALLGAKSCLQAASRAFPGVNAIFRLMGSREGEET